MTGTDEFLGYAPGTMNKLLAEAMAVFTPQRRWRKRFHCQTVLACGLDFTHVIISSFWR